RSSGTWGQIPRPTIKSAAERGSALFIYISLRNGTTVLYIRFHFSIPHNNKKPNIHINQMLDWYECSVSLSRDSPISIHILSFFHFSSSHIVRHFVIHLEDRLINHIFFHCPRIWKLLRLEFVLPHHIDYVV